MYSLRDDGSAFYVENWSSQTVYNTKPGHDRLLRISFEYRHSNKEFYPLLFFLSKYRKGWLKELLYLSLHYTK